MTERLPHGAIAPNLTPFNRDLSIDRGRYISHAKQCLADGCVGLAPFGTTGEALSAGAFERMETLEALVNSGVSPARLLPGTGLTSLPDTAMLTRHAVELGCAGAMILPPFYYKDASNDGLFAYFAKLIENVGMDRLRVYLYHIPQVAGVGVPVAVVRRLRQAFPEIIAGIKDSSGDYANTKALLEIPGLIVYPGSELPVIEALEAGAGGCISGTANLNARAISRVIALAREGKVAAANELMQSVAAFRRKLQSPSLIVSQKRLLALASGDDNWAIVRPPLIEMDKADGERLASELKSALGYVAKAA